MKKFITILLMILIMPLSLYSASKRLDLQELSNYLQENYEYQSDSVLASSKYKEYWQSPEELIASKKGDCEDFAFLVREILVSSGYSDVRIYGYSLKVGGHASCVFYDPDIKAYRVFDNMYLLPETNRDPIKLITKVYWGLKAILILPEDKLVYGEMWVWNTAARFKCIKWWFFHRKEGRYFKTKGAK